MAVVAVKETPQLMPMQRIVGGVEGEHDPFRRLGVHRQKHGDEKPLDVAVAGDDLLVATRRVGTDRRQLQPVPRVATGERLAPIAFTSAFPAGRIFASRQSNAINGSRLGSS